MLTKNQKQEIIANSVNDLKNSQSVIFIDFTKVKTGDLNAFRKTVRSAGGELKVIKKKLLRIAMKEMEIDFNPEVFETQVGTIFSKEEIFTMASPAYKFSFAKILGGYDLDGNRLVSAEEVIMLGSLPPKEVLLSQLVGTIALPIKSLMFVLKERALKIA